jgi:hypothetical protein
MKGREIRESREWLLLGRPTFAAVLGVHLTTLVRWEDAGEETARVDPLQTRILEALRSYLQSQTSASRQEIGLRATADLARHGPLRALVRLMARATTEDRSTDVDPVTLLLTGLKET